MANETPNCYPQCTDDIIRTKLISLNPCIDISVIRTTTLFQDDKNMRKFNDLIEQTKEAGKLNGEFSSEFQRGNINLEGLNFNTADQKIGRFQNLYGFFSLLSGGIIATYKNIPIFSSPNIRTRNDAGFKPAQSIFDFLRTVIKSTAIGEILNNLTSGLVENVVNSAENVGGFFGWHPMMSPYFSFKENPFSNRPSLTVTLQLINDSETSVLHNEEFIQRIIKESLIRSEQDESAEGGASANPLLNYWLPPRLFNVGLKWGSEHDDYAKRYLLCTLDSSIKPFGLMREHNTYHFPDVYTLDLTFTSLLPDTTDIWLNRTMDYVSKQNIEIEENSLENELENIKIDKSLDKRLSSHDSDIRRQANAELRKEEEKLKEEKAKNIPGFRAMYNHDQQTRLKLRKEAKRNIQNRKHR